MIHKIKVTPSHFSRLKAGVKTFEILENSPGYQAGDKIVVQEWDPEPINSTDRVSKGLTDSPPLNFLIGFVHVLSKTEVVVSLLPITLGETDKS